MSQSYFNLPQRSQAELLKEAESQSDIPSHAIEKDIWVCWILQELFSLPIEMSFKGGTSLSKVFNLINRLSEDVDVAIDYRYFNKDLNVMSGSRSQLKKLSDHLKVRLQDTISAKIIPHLVEKVSSEFPDLHFNIVPTMDGESIKFYYPAVVDNEEKYLLDYVLIELGARNSTEPSEKHSIATILAGYVDSNAISLPVADVNVLSPVRTFWEKATLIHVECHRKRLVSDPDRLSRHWYDLAMLGRAWVGADALKKLDILHNVVDHKKAFFNASYANYDACLVGKFRLIPDKEGRVSLYNDFSKMQESGMFMQEAPMPFDELMGILEKLESDINVVVAG